MRTKLLITALLASTGAALGQGTLQFGNNFSGVFRAPIYCDPDSYPFTKMGQSPIGVPPGTTIYNGPLLQGTGFTVALFSGPVGISDPNSLVFVASTTFRTASGNALPAGLFQTTVVPIPGVAPAQIATLQVRVWDNQGGTVNTWAQVLANPTVSRGATPLFSSQPLGGLIDPNLAPSLPPQMTGWTSFSMFCVPEPGVLALGFLSLGIFLLCRHRHVRL